MMLMKSGSIVYSSINYITCSSMLDLTLKMIQLKCDVIPSMKIKVMNAADWNQNSSLEDHYAVYLSFDLLTKDHCLIRIKFVAVMTRGMNVHKCQL